MPDAAVLEAAYPPLVPLDEMPLHPAERRKRGQWWACDHMSRPRSARVVYDWRCRYCAAHASHSLRAQGDQEQEWRREPGAEPVVVLLSWLVARSLAAGVA